MHDLISLGVQAAKDRITEFRAGYSKWASVHNPKYDGGVSDEQYSASSEESDSTMSGQRYAPIRANVPPDVPPETYFRNFVKPWVSTSSLIDFNC